MSVQNNYTMSVLNEAMSQKASGKADSSTQANSDESFACRECGKEYEYQAGLTYHYKTDGNDCSGFECPTCAKDHFINKHGVRLHHGKQHGESIAGDVVECSWCGESKRVSPYRVEQSNNHFCSSDCESKWRSENIAGKNHHQYNRITVECDWCGEKLERWPSIVENNERHFCNAEECEAKWLSENNRGKDHPNWKGGSDTIQYGSNWKWQREKAKERDNYECQICGMTKEEQGFALDVHHIQHVESFEKPKDANKLSNLLTVCRSCHRRIEGWNLIPDTNNVNE